MGVHIPDEYPSEISASRMKATQSCKTVKYLPAFWPCHLCPVCAGGSLLSPRPGTVGGCAGKIPTPRTSHQRKFSPDVRGHGLLGSVSEEVGWEVVRGERWHINHDRIIFQNSFFFFHKMQRTQVRHLRNSPQDVQSMNSGV